MLEASIQELVIERVLVLFSAIFFFLIALFIFKKKNFFYFSGRNKKDLVPPSSKEIFLIFGSFFFLQLFVAPLILKLFWGGSISSLDQLDTISYGWINFFYFLIESPVVLGVVFLSDPVRWKLIWGGAKKLSGRLFDLLIGAISWFISYPAAVIAGQIVALLFFVDYQKPSGEQVPVENLKAVMGEPLLFFLTVLATCILIPILEETLFRGVLQDWFSKRFGTVIAIPITSLIFTGFHFSSSQGSGNYEILPSLFVLSCFLGFIYERQGSLWAPIGLHGTFNSISVMMLVILSR
jgi:membrane protease YdiL (CAAX protease family)